MFSRYKCLIDAVDGTSAFSVYSVGAVLYFFDSTGWYSENRDRWLNMLSETRGIVKILLKRNMYMLMLRTLVFEEIMNEA